ncbi:MAG TPA: surface-adhesin E family protein [Pyrinomonadaceae bacterium]|nr:surface-adhesin E family protein [Pyrinomonadaceae bacterium]
MSKAILVLALLLVAPSAFGQNNNSVPSGGKTSETSPTKTTTPAKKKSVTKTTPKPDKPVASPCGVYKSDSNLGDKWFSLGQSGNRYFWYNPHKTTCDVKTGVLKTWIKEVHKNTDGDYAMVLYEFKCKTNQLRVKTVIEYDKNGGLLETNNHPDDAWQDVAPNTAGETMMKTICGRS